MSGCLHARTHARARHARGPRGAPLRAAPSPSASLRPACAPAGAHRPPLRPPPPPSTPRADSYAHALTLYESLSTLYPHNQELTAKLDTLASKGEFFKGVKDQMEASRVNVDGALAALAALHKDLSKKTDDRASFRQDIKHYEEKLPKLKADEGKGPKEKERFEENSKKLEDVRGR